MFKALYWALCAGGCAIMAFSSACAEELTTTHGEQKGVSLTIYNHDMALIKDQRHLHLPQGECTLAYKDVSGKIRPETALLTHPTLQVVEQNFEYDLLSPSALLKKYVGQDVTLVQTNPATGKEQEYVVTVLSAGDGQEKNVVLQRGDRIETGIPGRLVFSGVPDTLRERPTLTMLVKSTEAGEKDLELSYLSSGLSWKADYVAELSPNQDGMTGVLDLAGWVTLHNDTGSSYAHAQVQLVAGEVNQVPDEVISPVPMATMMRTFKGVEMAVQEESLFEYHLYTLPRKTTVKDKQQKQVTLLQANKIAYKKDLVIWGQPYYYQNKTRDIGENLKADVFVELVNTKASGLGMPLPAGVVRVYSRDSKDGLQFVGEDRIDHTPIKEKIRLRLGQAFDVTADKRQLSFHRMPESNTVHGNQQRIYESRYEILVKNGKKEPVTVKLKEPLPGDWEMVFASQPHTKESASLVSWSLTIPPLSSKALTYQVKVVD